MVTSAFKYCRKVFYIPRTTKVALSQLFHFRNVIVTDYEAPENHVVLKATIYNLGEAGSLEGASLHIRHEDNGDCKRELIIMPHRSGIASALFGTSRN
jgi:hypothetical protein